MALTYATLEAQVRHTLGREPSSSVSPNFIINQAGQFLARCYPWKWLVRPPVLLDLRGTVTVAGASWVNGTLTLTQVGAFTNYVYKAGDQLVVTAGTNTTLGTYNVASRVSNDAITLTASIGATASAVSGTMDFPWIVLPLDFAECLRLQGVDSTTTLSMRTYQQVIDARTLGLGTGASSYIGSIMWRGAFTDLTPAESSPVARIELDRIPSTNQTGAFRMVYRTGWPAQSDDASLALLPVWIEPLFVQYVRAFARGFMEEDTASLDERLVTVRGGPIFQQARRADSMIQRSYGVLQPGEIGMPNTPSFDGDGWLANPAAPPLSA